MVSKCLTISVAKALIKCHPEMNIDHTDLDNSAWDPSLFQRIRFAKRIGTTGKVKILESLREEIEISYFDAIVNTVEKKNIPISLLMNLDQTPAKYVPGNNKSMVFKGSKSISICGSTDKRIISPLTGRFYLHN